MEAKYRAKTANVNGVQNHCSYWVYGQLKEIDDKNYPYLIDGCFIKPETLEKYTGKNDKNGKEIYKKLITKR